MDAIFDITGDDIAELSDTDLRSLIGLLCEADYRSAGIITKGVTWGGHQDAPDGGFDVFVDAEEAPTTDGFVPRRKTGIQVKKPDMPPSAIQKEMCPNGTLRPQIAELLVDGGAYIIISSSGSTTGSALDKRRSAMSQATKKNGAISDPYLDFYDRGRIATWVRTHPSLMAWVHQHLGRSVSGWRPYERWTSSGNIVDDFILDEKLRLVHCSNTADKKLDLDGAIKELREALSREGSVVRLVGLSGVGKTRFAQALFESELGDRAPDQNLVIYTDMSDSPNPSPTALANQMINEERRIILCIDNCPPTLHRKLAMTAKRTNSKISLLTIEYDISEDLPEDTNVYRLEPASEDLIERMVSRRFRHVSQVDARTISEFSGGNARVAIALASTIEAGDSLSELRDNELFERLFWQTKEVDVSLLRSAEVLSLVYSFDATTKSDGSAELATLGAIAEKTATSLFRDVSLLQSRELIQKRGKWRAVLPHAIANRLAKTALRNIPSELILNILEEAGNERLLKSFARRLGYLHDHEVAHYFAALWLAPDGWIGSRLAQLTQLELFVLQNLAPISPEATLKCIEFAVSGTSREKILDIDHRNRTELLEILWHLAYDDSFFIRSCNLLLQFSLTEIETQTSTAATDTISSLFHIHLSGSHATLHTRSSYVREIFHSADPYDQKLGIKLLDSALEAWHFSSLHQFDFGARPRDFGYHPTDETEISDWFLTFLKIAVEFSDTAYLSHDGIRRALANSFRGLWTMSGIQQELANACTTISNQAQWNEGWQAVKSILNFDLESMSEAEKNSILQIEKSLRPMTLVDVTKAYVLGDQCANFDFDFDSEEGEPPMTGYDRVQNRSREIGAEMATDETAFLELLPKLVSSDHNRLGIFGMGLADGSNDLLQTFWQIRNQYAATHPSERRDQLLEGFMTSCHCRDTTAWNTILDQMLEDPLFGEWFPIFQISGEIDERGMERLRKSLSSDLIDIRSFGKLAYGRNHEKIEDDNLSELLNSILEKGNEQSVSETIHILAMRFHGISFDSTAIPSSLINTSRLCLESIDFTKKFSRNGMTDHSLRTIAQCCLAGEQGKDYIKTILANVSEGIKSLKLVAINFPKFLSMLAKLQPIEFLDSMLTSNKNESTYPLSYLFGFSRRDDPFDSIDDAAISQWCLVSPEQRYVAVISTFGSIIENESGVVAWRRYIVDLFSGHNVSGEILGALYESLFPKTWSGSLSTILESKKSLLVELCTHANTEVAAWAKQKIPRLNGSIERYKADEDELLWSENQSFE